MKEIHIKSIVVDECPNCNGIYFDAGELDALLEKGINEQKSFFRKLAKTVVPGL